jgi:trimeric autotransporter adhesin
MVTFRIVAAGAILFAMAGAASAQSDTSQAPSQEPGKPVSLLQMLFTPRTAAASNIAEAPSATVAPAPVAIETTAPTRIVHRHWHHRRSASKKSHAAQDEAAATTPAPQNDSAQTNVTPPSADTNGVPAAATFDAPATASWPSAQATASALSEPSAMVVDGHTVQITSQDEINALDLAASSAATDTPPQPAAGQADIAADAPATADNIAAADSTPADTPVIAFAEREDTGNNRDVWYEDLLATLGGVLAAASAAWFLLGSAPPRRDGSEPMLMYETERMRR